MEVNPNLSEKAQYDYALVLRATKEKDQKAYAELMQRYEGAIFHLINRMVFSEDDAEDLTIETFTKAFKRLNQYTPAFAFSTWLFKIASNHTIDFIRKKRINALSLDRGFTNDEGDRRRSPRSPRMFLKERLERLGVRVGGDIHQVVPGHAVIQDEPVELRVDGVDGGEEAHGGRGAVECLWIVHDHRWGGAGVGRLPRVRDRHIGGPA